MPVRVLPEADVVKVVITSTVKDKGSITWAPVDEPEGGAEGLRDLILDVATKTRTVLRASDYKSVHVKVAFKPDVTVEVL